MIPKLTPARTLDELEHNVAAIDEYQRVCAAVTANRKIELAKSLPRDRCPGCFSGIYDGAAAQGWCCDCWPRRAEYVHDERKP